MFLCNANGNTRKVQRPGQPKQRIPKANKSCDDNSLCSTNQSFMKSSAHCFRLISEGKFCFLISCYFIVNIEMTAQLNKKYVPRGKNYPNHTINVSMFRCCVNPIIFNLGNYR